PGKLVLGGLHGLAHLLLLAALVSLAASVWGLAPSGGVWTAPAFPPVGGARERPTNEAFPCQHLMDDKSFLRLHIGPGGTLTIYPVGIGRVPRRWRPVADGDRGGPWFQPGGHRPARPPGGTP